MMKWAISEHGMNFFGLRYGVYQRATLSWMSFIIYDLTFIYISFAKIFCQNKIKKNRKFFSQFFVKMPDIRCRNTHDKRLSCEL